MSYLVALDGPMQGKRYRLGPSTSVGGGAGDSVLVPGLPVGAIEIAAADNEVVARAAAPFRVNDADVVERTLRHGDVVAVGGTRFQFRSEDTRSFERRSAAHLGALYRVATVITGDTDFAVSMSTALEILLEETAAVRGAVFLLDEDVSRLERTTEKARPDAAGEPFAWEAAYGSLADLQRAAGGWAGATLFPIAARSQVLGAIVVQGPPPGGLAERDVELLTAVALIASVAAENRRNVRQREEYGRLLMSIEKATMWLSSYLEREPILGEAVGFARSIFRASCVSIVALSSDGKTARVVRNVGPRKTDASSWIITVGEGMCGRVLASGKPLLSPDPATGRPPEGFSRTKRYRTDSFAIVPIFSSVAEGAEILGAINVADKIGGRPFNEHDLELLAVLARAVGVALNNAELYERATVDSLTRLYVRQHFFYALEEALAKAQKARRPLSLAIADLDDFKKVNDTHGHPAGDAVLREVGAAMKRTMRPGDLAARYGGEEFAMILPNATLAEGRAVCERILEAVRATAADAGNGVRLKITASIGVAEMRSGDSVESLIARADAAQYRAKYGGKNRLEAADK